MSAEDTVADMLCYSVILLICSVAWSCQTPLNDSRRLPEASEEMLDAMDLPVSPRPVILLVQKYPKYLIMYQLTPQQIIDNIQEKRHVGRSIRDTSSSSSSREGRFLLKMGFKQLKDMLLWGSALASTPSTGSVSATNQFTLFGKTVNSALSLAYGDRVFVPPGFVPPGFVPPGIVPPVFPRPIVPPFVPPVGAPFPVQRFGPSVQTSAGVAPPMTSATSLDTANARVTAQVANDEAAQAEEEDGQLQLMEQYLQVQKIQKKLLDDYNNLITQQQKIREDQNDRWRQFLKQHNSMVSQLNAQSYLDVPKVNEI